MMHVNHRKRFLELDDERRNLLGLAECQKAVICLGDPQPKSPGIYTITGPIVELDASDISMLLRPIVRAKLSENSARLAAIGVDTDPIT